MEGAAVWNHLRGLTPLSLCDWPGRPCCVVFLGGCNLRCPTCHNAALAWDMDSLPRLPPESLLGFLGKRARWLSGVTVTGGEPTSVPGLGEILHDIAKFDLPIKLDTNGMRPDVVELLLAEKLVHTFAVDVKGPFSKYPELTGGGASEADAHKHLSRIFALAENRPGVFRFRTTRVPLLDETDIEAVRALLPPGHALTLQPYQQPRQQPGQQAGQQTGRSHALTDIEARRTSGDLVN